MRIPTEFIRAYFTDGFVEIRFARPNLRIRRLYLRFNPGDDLQKQQVWTLVFYAAYHAPQ